MSKLKNVLVDASLRNRIASIAWKDVKKVFDDATSENKNVLLLAINNKNYMAIGREVYEMLRKQIEDEVKLQVDTAIAAGSVTVEQLEDIFV